MNISNKENLSSDDFCHLELRVIFENHRCKFNTMMMLKSVEGVIPKRQKIERIWKLHLKPNSIHWTWSKSLVLTMEDMCATHARETKWRLVPRNKLVFYHHIKRNTCKYSAREF